MTGVGQTGVTGLAGPVLGFAYGHGDAVTFPLDSNAPVTAVLSFPDPTTPSSIALAAGVAQFLQAGIYRVGLTFAGIYGNAVPPTGFKQQILLNISGLLPTDLFPPEDDQFVNLGIAGNQGGAFCLDTYVWWLVSVSAAQATAGASVGFQLGAAGTGVTLTSTMINLEFVRVM